MSAVAVIQEQLTIERALYAAYLLAWSKKPEGTPLTFDQWQVRRDS